jgi:hypothetical protein
MLISLSAAGSLPGTRNWDFYAQVVDDIYHFATFQDFKMR